MDVQISEDLNPTLKVKYNAIEISNFSFFLKFSKDDYHLPFSLFVGFALSSGNR